MPIASTESDSMPPVTLTFLLENSTYTQIASERRRDGETERQRDRETDRETDRDRQRQTETEIRLVLSILAPRLQAHKTIHVR